MYIAILSRRSFIPTTPPTALRATPVPPHLSPTFTSGACSWIRALLKSSSSGVVCRDVVVDERVILAALARVSVSLATGSSFGVASRTRSRSRDWATADGTKQTYTYGTLHHHSTSYICFKLPTGSN